MSAASAPLRRATAPTPLRGEGTRPQLRVVPEPKRRHPVHFILLYVALGAATVFGALSLNALAAGDAVAARELERQVVEAEREYALLVADVAELENPARIRQAGLDLGMVPAGSVRFLVVEDTLPADGATPDLVADGGTTDPLKSVLSAER